ncbi:trypsin-like peptidase domain-containing protein [Altererythrobacter sp.]|uniref:trypsin-like peptidase domain-containing protein n=1 Tax=Altererythrobacter sp. TaxID=1872480 RepID=UPI003CFF53FF
MTRLFAFIALLFSLALPSLAHADPADIDAAARGVVRVVIIGTDGQEVYPISHGSGFAITPTTIVTNAHVIREALQDDTLRIGIVPSEGEEAAYARPVSVNPRNDLALVEVTEGSLRLPPLTVAGTPASDLGEVSAVGYPMNVDRAQGLDIGDIFRSQPPVKSRGFLSGARPSRQFDTILHTAPIARGNSGGPLLDGCGRVIGVNSFGADSDGSDAEFYFAVSTRELLPFLRDNEIEARTNALPCRSIDDLDAAERARLEQQRADARARLEARDAELRDKRNRAQLEAQLEVLDERENAMAVALILMMLSIGSAYIAVQERKREEGGDRRAMITGGLAALAAIGAVGVWLSRPGLEEIDERVAAALDGNDGDETPSSSQASEGTLLCTIVPERSRITGAKTDDVEFDWAADGCVNGRTQYGFASGEWSRVFVPDDEAAVSVNTYDPQTRTFRTDRYLLGRSDMEKAREARAGYEPPKCGVTEAARQLGEQQQSVLSMLPAHPNERLVYSCQPREKRGSGGQD